MNHVSVLHFLKAFWTPETLPFILAFVTAFLTFRFDSDSAETATKRRRAAIMFIVGGVIGTILSLFIFGEKQIEAEQATESARRANLRAEKISQDLNLMTSRMVAATNQMANLNERLETSSAENRKLQEKILSTQKNFLGQIALWFAKKPNGTNNIAVTLKIFQNSAEPFTNSENPEIRDLAERIVAKINDAQFVSNDQTQSDTTTQPIRPGPSLFASEHANTPISTFPVTNAPIFQQPVINSKPAPPGTQNQTNRPMAPPGFRILESSQ
jgi:predicted PurR-regulated permease PerM